MNCINCYHYQSCANIDVTGYVTDREKTSEEVCEHFITPEEVHPTAHWVRKVSDQPWSKNVRVEYVCSHCGCSHERVYTQEFFPKELWYNYQSKHWMPGIDLYSFCHGCGAKMDLSKTDHRNHVVEG